eukprot:TRINITY_DN487_c0_g1_i1.p1 TRINITY_DN487_c0_g1~~TRINITY_DN487_c0_g1_i1.p1  ORF type:complete len:495 (+),score=140.79 TRINITY_DN487_c0_g1_i1:96-1580(+)
MEIRLDTVNSLETLPKDMFVSMRVGDSQKQTRLAATRSFKFPVDAKGKHGPFGRVEVFRRIGAATVPLDQQVDGAQELEVGCSDMELSCLRLRLAVNAGAGGNAMQAPSSPLKAASHKGKFDQAKLYLDEHNLEEVIAAAMREVIRERPADPLKYLTENLIGIGKNVNGKEGKRSKSPQKAAPPAPAPGPPPPPANKPAAEAVEESTAAAKSARPAAAAVQEPSKPRPQSVVPFRPYFAAHLCSSDLSSIWKKFPAAAATVKVVVAKPQARPCLKPGSFREYAAKYTMQGITPAGFSGFYNKFPKYAAIKAAAPAPAAVKEAPWRRKESEPVAEPEEPRSFMQKASVGTWLMIPRPDTYEVMKMPSPSEATTPAPALGAAAQVRARPYNMRPSAGTLGMPLPFPDEDEGPSYPVYHAPSVGTWLQGRPSEIEKPWYYKKPEVNDKTANAHICLLQDEILKKDREIEEQRLQLIMLADQLGPDMMKKLGLKVPHH